MAEAIALTRSMQDLLSENVRAPHDRWEGAPRNAFNEQTQRARALSRMLTILGVDGSGGAL